MHEACATGGDGEEDPAGSSRAWQAGCKLWWDPGEGGRRHNNSRFRRLRMGKWNLIQ